jgi:hypothetical protein
MPTQDSSELRGLAASNPVDLTELEATIEKDRAWATIEARLAADPRPQRRSPRRGRRRIALAIGTAALLLSVVLALTPSRRDRQGRVARLLDATAAVASAHGGPHRSASSPYLYVESESADLVTFGDGGGWSALVKTRRQEWAAADGSGRLRETRSGPIFLGPRDEDRARRAGAPRLGGRSSDRAARAGTLGDADLARWSTDPARLRTQLEERAKRADAPRNVEMLVLVGDLLRQADAPPKLRAALYRAAAEIPGVAIVDDARDPLGRAGRGIAVTSDHSGDRERYELIFDPRTSMLLAEETRLLDRVPYVDAEPPALIEYTAYLRYEPVRSTRTCPRNASCE